MQTTFPSIATPTASSGINLLVHEPVITYRTRETWSALVDTATSAARRFRELLSAAPDPTVESVVIITHNHKLREVGSRHLTVGTATSALVGVADTLRIALLLGGTGFLLAHNHPSGDPSPSNADLRITRELREAARMVGLEFSDHIIIGQPGADPAGVGHFSFRCAGLL